MGDLRSRKKTSKKQSAVRAEGSGSADSKVRTAPCPRSETDTYLQSQEDVTEFPIEDFGPSFIQSGAFLWISGALVIVALYCAQPALFKDLIGFWIGYSEHYDVQTPAEVPEARRWLPADTAKRDAVVNAFKHAWHAYGRFGRPCT